MSKLLKVLLTVLCLSIALFITSLYFNKYQSPQLQFLDSKPIRPTTAESPKMDQETTFIFAGDAMFGRAVYSQFHSNLKDAFQNLGPDFFQDKDLAILNLEGPIVNSEFIPDTNPDNLIMKFPLQTVDVLTFLNINAVGLANNHTPNQGTEALSFTREILAQKNIVTVGDPQNTTDLVKTFSLDKKPLSIIAVNILANTPDLSAIISEQKNAGAFIIVFPHWGSEYETIHNESQEKLAHSWIDAGADMIVGSHPHVIQDTELYENRPIFYSVGNFLFDQTFSQNTQKGLVVSGKILEKKLYLELLPIKSVHLKPELLEGQEKEDIVTPLKKALGFENQSPIILELK